MQRCHSAHVEQVAVCIKEHYKCKNKKASISHHLKERKMPNAINEEVGLCLNPSSFVNPNASTFGKSVRGNNSSSKS